MENTQHLKNDRTLSVCPLCQSKKIKTIGPVEYTKMIFADTPISLKNIPYYDRCSHCKSGFIQNAIQEKDANVLYSKKCSRRWSSPIPFTKRRTKKTVKLITKLLKPGMRILDIGCSTGQLLEFATQFNCDSFGVESSKSAQKICRDKGLKCFSTMEEIKYFTPFDVVFLIDTIEHIYDVPAFLSYLKEILITNGLVVLLTGNNNSVPAKIFKNNWWYLRFPEHIIFPSIKYLTQFSGFNLQNHQNTYAFKYSEKNSKKNIKSSLKNLVICKGDGHESIFPDHYCVVLRKD